MTTRPSAEPRRQVEERAHQCCEYCLVPQELAASSMKSPEHADCIADLQALYDQQRLRLLEVSRVKALREPAVDRRQ